MNSIKKFYKDHFTVPDKPYALAFGEWDIWHAKAKADYPFRYFMGETLPDALSWFNSKTFGRFNNVRYNLYNRFIYKKFALTSKLPRGEWYDMDTRVLHCIMDEIVDFVEVETAIHHCALSKEAAEKYGYSRLKNRWMFRKFRSAGAGLDHVNWAASLRSSSVDPWMVEPDKDESFGPLTGQAETSIELLLIYHWWTSIRPARVDPYEASGWSKFCEGRVLKPGGEKELEKLRELEEQYDKEDEDFLIRAIKIRKGLWT